ncbi:hypothetical protein NPIL_413021, partial [Nephila pilipes]
KLDLLPGRSRKQVDNVSVEDVTIAAVDLSSQSPYRNEVDLGGEKNYAKHIALQSSQSSENTTATT